MTTVATRPPTSAPCRGSPSAACCAPSSASSPPCARPASPRCASPSSSSRACCCAPSPTPRPPVRSRSASRPAAAWTDVLDVGAQAGELAAVVLAALAVGSEYTGRVALTTFVAVPRRLLVLARQGRRRAGAARGARRRSASWSAPPCRCRVMAAAAPGRPDVRASVGAALADLVVRPRVRAPRPRGHDARPQHGGRASRSSSRCCSSLPVLTALVDRGARGRPRPVPPHLRCPHGRRAARPRRARAPWCATSSSPSPGSSCPARGGRARPGPAGRLTAVTAPTPAVAEDRLRLPRPRGLLRGASAHPRAVDVLVVAVALLLGWVQTDRVGPDRAALARARRGLGRRQRPHRRRAAPAPPAPGGARRRRRARRAAGTARRPRAARSCRSRCRSTRSPSTAPRGPPWPAPRCSPSRCWPSRTPRGPPSAGCRSSPSSASCSPCWSARASATAAATSPRSSTGPPSWRRSRTSARGSRSPRNAPGSPASCTTSSRTASA